MSTRERTLEELISELPPRGREEVRDFVESLLKTERERGAPPAGDRDDELRQFFGSWDSGDPHSADNERIDADLAREYADTHEPRSHSQ